MKVLHFGHSVEGLGILGSKAAVEFTAPKLHIKTLSLANIILYVICVW